MIRPDDETLVAALSDIARETASAERTHEPGPGAWHRLQQRRTHGSGARFRRWLLGLGTAAAVAAAIVLAIGLRSGRALTYEVGGGAIEEGGYIRGPRDAWAPVQFSDGTRIELQAGARLSVAASGAHGARLRLDEGQARFVVKHLPKAAWTVEAGPYVVDVTGTVFDVRWSSVEEVAEVRLHAGSVRVSGPLLTDHVTLRPGQHLTAHLTARELRLDETGAGAPVAAPPPPHAEPASVPAALPVPAAQPPQTSTASPPPERPHAAKPHPRATALAAPASTWDPAGWSSRVSAGDARGVVAEASARGIDRVLAEADGPTLAALADAARYTGRADLAVRALQAERDRFAGTSAAGTAAFFLGRLADDRGAPGEGLTWYRRYLDEAPHGSYAAEALGREMLGVAQISGRPAARALAREYLRRFPDGTYLLNARSILEGP